MKILGKQTVKEIIKLIESENYYIANDGIIISDEEGIVLTLKEILKGKTILTNSRNIRKTLNNS